MRKALGLIYIVVICTVVSMAGMTAAYALQSSHYQFNETSLGGIGTADTHSTGYRALTSGGIIGFGSSVGTTMQVAAGNKTTDEPALSFAVASSGVSMGSFSPSTTATATSAFAVKNYTSYGYSVYILGNTPTNGANSITAMSTTGASTAGAEQFGINVVANTSPSTFGANPDHGQFGFGAATTDYGTTNNYRYVSGEAIASAQKSSGTTAYTISYIVNVSSFTVGGQYTSGQTLLCVATY